MNTMNALLNYWDSDCEHATTKVVRFVKKNGAITVRKQCQKCGQSVGSDLKKSLYNVDELPEWDNVLLEQYRAAKSSAYQEAAITNRREWMKQYDEYLNSELWRELRIKVLTRDNYKCQNCFRDVSVDSAQIHHVSYEGYKNLGHSFAFELLTLCKNCHKLWHSQYTAYSSEEVANEEDTGAESNDDEIPF